MLMLCSVFQELCIMAKHQTNNNKAAVSLRIAQSELGVNLLEHPPLGRLATALNDGFQVIHEWPYNLFRLLVHTSYFSEIVAAVFPPW